MPLALAAVAALLTALLIVPFHITRHVLPIPSFLEELTAGLLAGLIVVVVLFAVRRDAGRVPRVALPVLLLGLLAAVQLALGRYTHPSVPTLVMVEAAWFALVLWAAAHARRRWGAEVIFRVVASAILAGGLLSAMVAIVQWSGLRDSPLAVITTWSPVPLPSPRAYGNIGQSNLLANQLCLALAALGYLVAEGRIRWRWAVPAVALLVAGLFFTGSRVGALILVAFLLISAICWRATPTVATRRLAALSLGTLALFLAVDPILTAFGVDTGELGALRRAAGDDGSGVMRVHFWAHAATIFLRAPLIGTGFGTYAWEYFAQSPAFPQTFEGIERNAHNLYAQFAAEGGAVGLVLALWFTVGVVRLTGHLQAGCQRTAWLMLMSVTFLHSLVEFPLWHLHFLAPFAILVGLAESRFVSTPAPRAAPYVIGALLLAGSLWTHQTWRAWRATDHVVDPTSYYGFREARLGRLPEAERAAAGTLLEPYLRQRIAIHANAEVAGREDLARFSEEALHFWPNEELALRTAVRLLEAGRTDAAVILLGRMAVSFPSAYDAFIKANLGAGWLPPDRVSLLPPARLPHVSPRK